MNNLLKKKHTIHDSLYNAVFNAVFSTLIYSSSGADLEQTVKGVVGATLLGLVSGPINGYSLDTFRDFVGTKKSQRLPKRIQDIGNKTKRILAAGLVATTIGTTAGVYKIKDEFFSNPPAQEQMLENNSLEEKVSELSNIN